MKKKYLLLVTALCIMLAGCGATEASFDGSKELADEASLYSPGFITGNSVAPTPAVGMEEDYYAESSDASVYTDSSEAEIVKNTMMIAREAQVSIDVEDLNVFDQDIRSKVSDYDGYFEESEITDYDNEWDTKRYARYTIKVPAEKLDGFLSIVDGSGKITSKTISMDDVSLQYVDIQAHIEALEKEKDHLEDLYRYTEDVSEIIQIEDRLSYVQATLDSYNRQRMVLEGRVSYSKIILTATEEREIRNPVRKMIHVNLGEKLIDGLERTVNMFFDLIIAIPVVVLIAAFAVFCIFVLKKVWAFVFRKNGDEPRYRYMIVPVQEYDAEAKRKQKEKKSQKDARRIDEEIHAGQTETNAYKQTLDPGTEPDQTE